MPSQEHENATAESSRESRKKKIHSLVVAAGGYEEMIRMAMEERDWELVKELEPLKKMAYQRLKRYVYYGDSQRTQ